MSDIQMILEEVAELENEFYGREEDDFEGGVFENNDDCAEWARSNVEDLFIRIRELASEVYNLENKLEVTRDLLSEAHDVMDDVHLYDTELYREISKLFYGEDE